MSTEKQKEQTSNGKETTTDFEIVKPQKLVRGNNYNLKNHSSV